MEELKVRNIIIPKQGKESTNYKRFLELVKEKNIKVHISKLGDKIKIEKNVNFFFELFLFFSLTFLGKSKGPTEKQFLSK